MVRKKWAQKSNVFWKLLKKQIILSAIFNFHTNSHFQCHIFSHLRQQTFSLGQISEFITSGPSICYPENYRLLLILFRHHFLSWHTDDYCLSNFIMKGHSVWVPICLDKPEAAFNCRGKISQAALYAMPEARSRMIQWCNPDAKNSFTKGVSFEEIKLKAEIQDRQKTQD